MKLFLIALALATPSLVFAKTMAAKPTYFQSLTKFSKDTPSDYPWLTLEEAATLKTEIAKTKRTPSSDLVGSESQMSQGFRDARDQFLKITTADELDAFLKKTQLNYESYKDNDLRFFASQIVILRSLRGVVWKMIPVFSRAKVTHSLLLTTVKSFASQMKILLPTDQWNAGFDYITQPYIDDSGQVSRQYADEGELIGDFSGPVYQSILLSAKRIKALSFKDAPIVWDNQLLYGKASFQDGIDRYRLLGEVERLSALAAIHGTLGTIAYERAYSFENMIDLYEKIGKLYGVDGFLFSQVDGAPSSKKSAIVKESKFRNFGTLVPDGKTWTTRAFKHLKESTLLGQATWNEIKAENRAPTEAFIFDTSSFPSNQRPNQYRIDNGVAAVSGKTQLKSSITGEVVTVDMPGFFANPPADLKVFLPTQFETTSENLSKSLVDTSGKTNSVQYRNYYFGRATAWDPAAYQLIFPSVTKSSDIPDAVRILSQSWGTSILAFPILSTIE